MDSYPNIKKRTLWFSQPPQVSLRSESALQESFDAVDEESFTNDINIQLSQEFQFQHPVQSKAHLDE